jgi:hypothetical protein
VVVDLIYDPIRSKDDFTKPILAKLGNNPTDPRECAETQHLGNDEVSEPFRRFRINTGDKPDDVPEIPQRAFRPDYPEIHDWRSSETSA